MAQRRAVAATSRENDAQARADARAEIDAIKRALGERGQVWWDDGAPDFNRHLARNTPYADWYKQIEMKEDAKGLT